MLLNLYLYSISFLNLLTFYDNELIVTRRSLMRVLYMLFGLICKQDYIYV